MTGALQATAGPDYVPLLVWAGIAVVGLLLLLSIWTSEQKVSWKFALTAVLAAGLLAAIGLALQIAAPATPS